MKTLLIILMIAFYFIGVIFSDIVGDKLEGELKKYKKYLFFACITLFFVGLLFGLISEIYSSKNLNKKNWIFETEIRGKTLNNSIIKSDTIIIIKRK